MPGRDTTLRPIDLAASPLGQPPLEKDRDKTSQCNRPKCWAVILRSALSGSKRASTNFELRLTKVAIGVLQPTRKVGELDQLGAKILPLHAGMRKCVFIWLLSDYWFLENLNSQPRGYFLFQLST